MTILAKAEEIAAKYPKDVRRITIQDLVHLTLCPSHPLAYVTFNNLGWVDLKITEFSFGNPAYPDRLQAPLKALVELANDVQPFLLLLDALDLIEACPSVLAIKDVNSVGHKVRLLSCNQSVYTSSALVCANCVQFKVHSVLELTKESRKAVSMVKDFASYYMSKLGEVFSPP